MFGAPLDLIKIKDKVVGKTTDDFIIEQIPKEQVPSCLQYNPIRNMSMRQAGKKSNHSFNYGLSPMGFSLQYTVEFQEAKRCYDLYHRAYPTIKLWHQSIVAQLQRNRTLVNCFGRVRTFLDRWSEDLFKAAYSYLPQSTVADGLNLGLQKIYADKEVYMQKADLLGQVHDSVLFQFPLDSISELAKALLRMRTHLEPTLEYGRRQFTIPTDCKMGKNWGSMVELKFSADEEELLQNLKDTIAKLGE